MVFAEAAPWPILWKGRVQDRKNDMDCQRGITGGNDDRYCIGNRVRFDVLCVER